MNEKVTVELTHTFDGKPQVIGKIVSLELKKKHLYIEDKKVFHLFGKQGQFYRGFVEYNHIDLTEAGRMIFEVPENWTNHLTKIRIIPNTSGRVS
jgi:hypothetical protein